MAGKRKKKINVYVDADDLASLKSISRRTSIPMSVLFRRGLKTVIKHFKK